MKQIFWWLFALAIGSTTYATTMLDVEPDGRAAALGEATLASGIGPAAIWSNPAGIATGKIGGAVFGSHQWIADIRGTHVAGSLRWHDWALGTTIRSASSEDLERRDQPTFTPQGTFGVRESDLGIALARSFKEKIRGGIEVNYRYSRIEDDVATEWRTSYGIQYDMLPNLTGGLALQHIGAAETSGKSSSIIRGGVEYSHDFPAGTVLVGAGEIRMQQEKIRAGIGLEAQILHILSLRGGYQFGYDSQGISYGVGATWRNLKINLGIVPFKNDLGSTTRISIQFDN